MSAESYLPLPLTVEGVTTEWLTAALRQRVPMAESFDLYLDPSRITAGGR